MFVKVYHYHIQPGKIDESLRIQERVKRIYDKHVRSRQLFLQNREDQSQWLEIHWYNDVNSYHAGQELINKEPELSTLWNEFQATLDPNNSAISEEYYEEVWLADNLGDE